jgi:DNA replication initiation complex subunit (GINS family)
MFEGLVNMLAEAKAQIYGAQKAEPPVRMEEVTAPKSSENMVLRILEDVPSFAGVAGNYKLKKEDIASLPRKVAEILVKKGKAQEIQVQ